MPVQLLPALYKMLGHLAVVVTGASVFTAIDFNHTITLGSVLIAIIVIVIAGIFTVRSKIATVWREEAEGERARAERLEVELAEEKASRAAFERAQQELRHDLKDELAGLRAQVKSLGVKTDLTAALDTIRAMNEHTADAVVSAMNKTSLLSEQRDSKTQELLGEIRDKLPAEPIPVEIVHVPHTE